MINTLKGAIAKKLKESFPDFTVYLSNPPQNIKEPCFIVEARKLDSRDLAFVPKTTREITEIYIDFTVTILLPRNDRLLGDVMSRALLCLKWLETDGGKPVMPFKRSANPIDDSSAVVNLRVYREAHVVNGDLPFMEEMVEEIGVKNG